MSSNPVTYAEETLGVHAILEGTLEAHAELDNVLTTLSEKTDARRDVERQLSDREMDILIEERGKHSDMSQAAMEKHMKVLIHQDEDCRKLRQELLDLKNDLDGADMDRKMKERAIEIGCARMNELGGYLHYLAACKQAATARVATAAQQS